MSVPLKCRKKTKNNFGELHGTQKRDRHYCDIKVRTEDNYISIMQSALKTEVCR